MGKTKFWKIANFGMDAPYYDTKWCPKGKFKGWLNLDFEKNGGIAFFLSRPPGKNEKWYFWADCA